MEEGFDLHVLLRWYGEQGGGAPLCIWEMEGREEEEDLEPGWDSGGGAGRERERERGGHTKEDIPKVERERERERNGDRRPQSEAAQDMQIANHPYLHYYTTALAGFRCPAEGGGREEEGET